MKLAFLDLPDDQVDLISTARRTPDVELVLVASANPDALALRIAEVLQIPRSTDPLDLVSLKPDRVAVPSLESRGASALLRAGISPGIFVPLEQLAPMVAATATPQLEEVVPIEQWEDEAPEEPGTANRLGEIRDALALSEDRQRLFQEILSLAVSETGADSGSLMIVDEDEGELRIAFAEGLSSDTIRGSRQKIGEGIAGRVAEDGKPVVINDKIADPRYTGGRRDRSKIASAMSAPIKLDGRVIGVLNVSSDGQGKRFQESDLDRLCEIGGQISAILDRVVRRSRSDLDTIELRSRRTLESIFDGKEATIEGRLRSVAQRLAEQLGARAASIYAAEEGADRCAVYASGPPTEAGSLPVGTGLLAWVLQSGEPLYLSARGARVARGENPPDLLLSPIQAARSHGVLALECLAPIGTDLESFLRLVSRLTRYAAERMEQRKEDPGTERRIALIAVLADAAPRLMVAREQEGLLLESVAALRALFPAGLVAARLLGGGDDLMVRTAWDGPEEERERAHDREASLASNAIGAGVELSPATLEDDDLRGRSVDAGGGSAAVVPVRTADRVAGSLAVILPAGRSVLGMPELEALRKLALYVSIAWEHVRGIAGEERTMHDPLTGLLGGAGLESRIQEEVKRAERYHDRFLLTVCSITNYADLTSRHGGEFGERLLREFASALTRNVREVDAVARIGDARFAVLSPETDKDSGALLKRLDLILPRLECVRRLDDPGEVRLAGRQYTYPDEIPTGGELLSLIRGGH